MTNFFKRSIIKSGLKPYTIYRGLKMNKFSCAFLTVLFFAFTVPVLTQTPKPLPTPTEDDDVVKITTKLVQFDAIVTDKDGNQIKDLKAEDFEILQDGKPQTITNFSYVNTESPEQSSPVTTVKNGKSVILPPPARVRPENVGRIITFVVDDGNCQASQIGMTATREGIIKFINEQMLPNDLVSIYRTRGGSSLLQQYTSDKTLLLRTARQIRWYPAQGSCVSSDGSFFEAARSNSTVKITPEGIKSVQIESEADRKRREAGEDFNRSNQVIGTLGVIRYVVRGLERIGGRKTVFLFSDGIPMRDRNGSRLAAVDYLRDLTDLANRASVVFNVIDVRGVFSSSVIEARDEIQQDQDLDPAKPTGADAVAFARQAEVRNSQDGMFFLADETGGRFYHSSNFLDSTLRKALDQEKGYYLLAYEPEDETFKGKKFYNIEIKLKRPELRVISRAGFFGKTEEETKAKKRTGDSELYEAIVAPLLRAGLNLRLSAFFVSDAAQGNVVRALVHLDGKEIAFVDDANGMKKAVFDVIAVTLNEKNEVVDEFNRTHTFKVEARAIPFIKQNGLIYSTDVPVKKAGNYTFRLAARDVSSKLLGSASQIIQVPELKKNKIFLSGLTVSGIDAGGKFAAPSAAKPENALSLTNSAAVPAIRRFQPNSILAYAYTLYNAQIDKATNQPKLTVQVNLYRDGKIVIEGKPQTAELEKPSDPTRINDYGYMRLDAAIEKGDYALQVIVKDLLSNETTSQWIDFEIGN